MKKLRLLAVATAMSLMYACGQKTDVVDSGTYQGTVDKVEADKSEIYVETADGKRLELYFTDSTTLSKNGAEASFSELEKGKKVEVDVKKTGQRLDPVAVRILE